MTRVRLRRFAVVASVLLACGLAVHGVTRPATAGPEAAKALAAARDAVRQTSEASEAARLTPEGRRNQAEVDRTFAAYVKAIDDATALAARVVREQPETAAGLDAADLLLSHQYQTDDAAAAIDAVARHHATQPAAAAAVAGIVARIGYYEQYPPAPAWAAAGRLFDAADRAADRGVRGQAAMAWARRAQTWLQVADLLRGLDAAALQRPFADEVRIVRAEAGDDLNPDRLAAVAIGRLRAVVCDYGDLPDLHKPHGPVRQTLAEDAEPQLFDLQHLRAGMPAPEIDAADLEGRPLKLGDFRGRVVLLSFWASWCGPCMAEVPHERELAEKLAGRPFAFVGVNGDEVREHGLAVSRSERVPGRSFWNGEDGYFGPITRVERAGVADHVPDRRGRRHPLSRPARRRTGRADANAAGRSGKTPPRPAVTRGRPGFTIGPCPSACCT